MRTPALADTSPGVADWIGADMGNGTCSIEGCAKPAKTRSWCVGHYQRWRRCGDTRGQRPPKYATFEERIEYFADKSGGPDACWPWRGELDHKGYGCQRFVGAPTRMIHRLAYILANGPVPDDLPLDHTCHKIETCSGGDTCPHRRCVNPAHLEPVTVRVNIERGHSRSGQNMRKTHCQRGHPLGGDNLRLAQRNDGKVARQCVICCRARNRASAMRQKAKAAA